MKLIIVFANSDLTGASKVGLSYASACLRGSMDVLVICPQSMEGEPNLISEMARIGVRCYSYKRSFLGLFRMLMILAWDTTPSGNFDTIMSFNQGSAKILGVLHLVDRSTKNVFVQNKRTFSGNGWRSHINRIGYGISLVHVAQNILHVSKTTMRETIKLCGAKRSCLSVIPNGIPLRSNLQIKKYTDKDVGDVLTAIHVGRISEQKGQDILLSACRMISDELRGRVVLQIVGESDNTPEGKLFHRKLREMAENDSRGIQVEFLGWKDDVYRYLENADFYIQSSRWEGPPLTISILEAMSAGLPVILTDCAGMPHGFKNGETGIIVQSGDPLSLRHGIEKILLMDRFERRTMGESGKKLVEECYSEKSAQEKFVKFVSTERAQSVFPVVI